MTLLQEVYFLILEGIGQIGSNQVLERQAGTETSDGSDARRHRKKTGIITGTFHNKSTAA